MIYFIILLPMNFFTNYQPGFLPSDFCISQLLFIVHEISLSFDCSPGTGVFLDILKALDNV